MPSSRKARDAIIALMEGTGTGPVYDLGSGWGGLVIPLAKKYPNRNIVGYEVSFVPWLVSVLVKCAFRLDNLTVHRKNFLQADLSGAGVLIGYLHTKGMCEIADKLSAERRTEAFLISNTFGLPMCQPEKTIQINDFYKSPVYRYRLAGFNQPARNRGLQERA
jgi:16S rRNA A1518/A1519 N6-dimethyltransferase RsmA/KsgA/DIM1 with predicted DNA glycosylase/AP lyase activity